MSATTPAIVCTNCQQKVDEQFNAASPNHERQVLFDQA